MVLTFWKKTHSIPVLCQLYSVWIFVSLFVFIQREFFASFYVWKTFSQCVICLEFINTNFGLVCKLNPTIPSRVKFAVLSIWSLKSTDLGMVCKLNPTTLSRVKFAVLVVWSLQSTNLGMVCKLNPTTPFRVKFAVLVVWSVKSTNLDMVCKWIPQCRLVFSLQCWLFEV